MNMETSELRNMDKFTNNAKEALLIRLRQLRRAVKAKAPFVVVCDKYILARGYLAAAGRWDGDHVIMMNAVAHAYIGETDVALRKLDVLIDSAKGMQDTGDIDWSRMFHALELNEMMEARHTILGGSLKNRQGFLRELLLNVEKELGDYKDIDAIEDQIARCFEEEDYYDLEHYKSEILDLTMHSMGIVPYERVFAKNEPKTGK